MVQGAATEIDYHLTSSCKVLLTSEAGDKLSRKKNVVFKRGSVKTANAIRVQPDVVKQSLYGIGTSFTESSAFVLAHLDSQKRAEVMANIYGEQGANFTLARTPIGATDFSVKGCYSYADVPEDVALKHFSVAVDHDGFKAQQYPGIKDETFDLLPMIQQALVIKSQQQESDLRIIASAWTAPSWMKDIEEWYQPGSTKNNFRGSGGSLKPEYTDTYADYIVRYLDSYQRHGVNIWGLTPVNEPLGNNGQWESMHFSAQSQRDFIKHHLGPKLHQQGYQALRLFMLDHGREHLEQWADVMYRDSECARYVAGAAVHWYESTFKVFEDVFQRVHEQYPEYDIIHTEGCIDDLGKEAPEGVLDPVGFKESGWFQNDAFWWNDNASDWAYSVTWPGVNSADHPLYTPVHRYARNIIVSLDNWVTGWIDWNIVLDKRGGPNHVGNYCGAPIMIDVTSREVYYTPVYYVLAQFSQTIRPGDRALQTITNLPGLEPDAMHACASINDDGLIAVQVLNTSSKSIDYVLQIGVQHAEVTLQANALQTLCIKI